MGLARAGSANQNDVVCIIEKVTSMKLPDQYFVYLVACEIKSIEIAIGWKASGFELIRDRSDFTLCRFCLEELRENWNGGLECRRSLFS